MCEVTFQFLFKISLYKHIYHHGTSFALNEEGYLLPTIAQKNNLPMFRLNAPVVIRAKVKEVRTNITIYSHTLLRIHVIGGQRSVRIAPPSLPPHHSDPVPGCWIAVMKHRQVIFPSYSW